jgi:hypothetical protein
MSNLFLSSIFFTGFGFGRLSKSKTPAYYDIGRCIGCYTGISPTPLVSDEPA